MEWYYAEAGQQRGPVSDAEFENLVRAGAIQDTTLVWRDGMSDWQPYGQVRPGAAPAEAVTSESAATLTGIICSQCGQAFAQDDVIRLGDVWVCAACKPTYVQRLKEGAASGLALDYAGFWTRAGAKILDGIILWVVNMGIGFVAGMVVGGAARTAGGGSQQTIMLGLQVVLMAFGIALNLGYGIFFLGKFGATPGKMAAKIRVVNADGSPIGYRRATGRCFAEILSGLICYIGYIMAGFDEEKRALHDRICDTRVIKS